MKEVELHRYAGPYEKLPFDQYVESPIGLVPKAGNKTRLIFHLSYNFGEEIENKSIIFHTLAELCKVSFNDLDHVIRNCLRLLSNCQNSSKTNLFFGKTDCSSGFRIIPTLPKQKFF